MIIVTKTTSKEKRILRRIQRILPLALAAITVDEFSARYLTVFQRHDTLWDYTGSPSFPITAINWNLLKQLKDKIILINSSTMNDIKYLYIKKCKVCQKQYFQKEITENQFDIFSDNTNIAVTFLNNVCSGEIMSCCNECAKV